MTKKEYQIKSVKAREILDSRGNPTIEVKVETNLGKFSASVPAGASKGKYEAVELRDTDGRGVLKAIENIEKIISPVLLKENLTDQKRIDEILINLDGTKNKSRLGANAILAISIAMCRAGAAANHLPLYEYINEIGNWKLEIENWRIPKPSFNMIEGGKHAQNHLIFQEFMIMPQKLDFEENLKIGKRVYQELKKILENKFGKMNVKLSFEGAFSAPLKEVSEALDFIMAAAKSAGYENDVKIAIDAAASEFFRDNNYRMGEKMISSDELLEIYDDLVKKFPIILIEDPFYEEDFESFTEIKKRMGERVIIFGDDLTVSNTDRIKMAQERKSLSGLILKPNQIGTVTETLEAAKLAKDFGWKIMVSNRAGETEDDFIADLSVGISADFIKSGAPFSKERMAKYNRLLKIRKELYG